MPLTVDAAEASRERTGALVFFARLAAFFFAAFFADAFFTPGRDAAARAAVLRRAVLDVPPAWAVFGRVRVVTFPAPLRRPTFFADRCVFATALLGLRNQWGRLDGSGRLPAKAGSHTLLVSPSG
jgi:hypothetical protein